MKRSSGDPCRLEGVRPILEALRAGRRTVEEVWLPIPPRSQAATELLERAQRAGAQIHQVPRQAETAALATPFPEESFEDLVARSDAPRLWVALDRVTDVGNLGSIARSAETAGATGLILEHREAPGLGPGAFRASAGALEHLAVARTPNLARALEFAAGEGFRVLAAHPSGTPLASVAPADLAGDVIWAFGSEDRGLRPAVLATAGLRVCIPMQGSIGSLGVAAAAAVLLHYTAAVRFAGGRGLGATPSAPGDL